MRKFFTLFAALVVAVVAGAITLATRAAEGEATFSAEVEQAPTVDYSTVNAYYSLSEIAAALNTNAETLAAALQDGSAQFGLFDGDGALIAQTADGPGSYWLKADGTVTNWGNESVVYNGLVSYDVESDVFMLPIGQFPEAMTWGDSWSNVFTLKYNGAEVTIAVTLNIPAEAPAKVFSSTTVQHPTKDYSYTTCAFRLSEIAEELGTDAETLEAALKSGEAQFGLFGEDGALIATTADGPGSYWLTAEGTVTNWGNESVVYNGLINYNSLTDAFIIPIGQFPDAMAAGSTWENAFVLKYADNEVALNVKLVVCEAAALTATVEQYPTNDYSSTPAIFPLADVAAALGTNAETLAAALSDGSAEFGIFGEDGTLIETTADGPGSYWMTAAGEVTNWGNSSVAYNSLLAVDGENISIPVGQFPDALVPGYTWSAVYTIKYNGASTTLGINLNIIERPLMDDPAEFVTALEVVKEYNATLEFTEGKQYEGKTAEIDVTGICEALGVAEKVLSSNIAKALITQKVYADESGSIFITDTLVNHRSSTDGWYGRYTSFDESTGSETPIAQNALMSYGGGCTFYLQNPSLEEETLSLTYGQYPGTMKPGDTDFAVLYIVNGTKAAKLTVGVEITPAETVDFTEMTKVGSQEVSGSLEVANGYTSVTVGFDAADVLAKLGCSADDVTEWNFADETKSSLVDAAMNDYWQSEEGYSQAWSTSPCCQMTVNLASGEVTLLQMAGKYLEIEEAQTFPMHYIITYGANYYEIDAQFTLKPIKQIESELNCVSQEYFSKQIIPANSYDVEGLFDIDLDYVAGLIGTRDFVLYGDKWNDEKGEYEWTKDYTCFDTANKGFGFWYGATTHEDSEYRVVVGDEGWNCASTNAFGFQIFTTGSVMFFQMPGQRQVGDSYDANMYLVNEETGDYVNYLIHVTYVNEIAPESETVGEEELLVEVSDELLNDDSEYETAIDLTAALEAIGLAPEAVEEATVIVPKSKTMFAETTLEESIFYNVDGYTVSPESEKAILSAYLEINEEGKPVIKFDDMGYFDEENKTARIKIGIEYNGKRYIHTLILTNDNAIITRINSVATPVDNTYTVYNLAGVKMNSLQKGINIVKMNGAVQKIYVK